ncbi:hypothetical protein [Natronosalvus vescus]|uniref:hypothetical protein n=1 Tax=Natronosalvus vescus TaxID=2953881 RepID=UPI002090AA5E|nr:hypothetical protein [Natronosalvus vescus]
MAEDAVLHRLNVIIVLLVAILAILLWPVLTPLILFANVVIVLLVGLGLSWALLQRVR